ncbi:hypothetical protein EJ08DRAFT_612890 [Tothia fuscella]|uniref:Uncharacterized protein n=1 Tax=Tothia fuscella TaxID=1048955 RepID=A0A9P4NQE5_9PEZI|nr:hypothetical protein EJ08DRAFT_612890 [Tothia fuscella]
MTTYLTKMRKGDLVALASQADIVRPEEMLKDDIVIALSDRLRHNASTYSSNPSFRAFYDRTGSPVKKERSVSTALVMVDAPEKPQRRRRQTIKATEDLDTQGEESSPEVTALSARTPRAVQHVAQRIPLPPSPAVMADYIGRGQATVSEKINSVWEKSGTTELIEFARETASTVVFTQLASLLVEAWGIQRVTFPWAYAFHIPANKITTHAVDVALPDLFNLLKVDTFWAPSTLWLTTSLFIPLLFAWFFNFNHALKPQRRAAESSSYRVDPFTFSVVRALTAYLVYAQGVTFGLTSAENVAVVNGAFPGGYGGVLIGAGIGALASLYEAILSKH